MKEIVSKWFLCNGCDRKITINFSEKEKEKQIKCTHCGKYSIITNLCKKGK
jgi:DNA-directed RNA polymerase subunit RPC12/RpoP